MANGTRRYNRYSLAEVASFSTAAPTAWSSWTHIPVEGNPDPTLEQATENANETSTDGASSAPIATVRSSSLQFEVPICTGTTSFDGAGSDTDPTSCYFQKALESYFGADAATFGGTTVAASSGPGNTTALKVASATGLTVGMAIQVGGDLRFVTAISGTDITLDADVSVYDENTVVYGGFNFEPTTGHMAEYLYLTHEKDTNTYHTVLGPGRISSLSIVGLAAKSHARYQATFSGDDWTLTTGASSNTGTLTENAFTGTKIIAQGGSVSIGGTAHACSDLSINFGVVHGERVTNSTSGADNGRDGWEVTDYMEPTITLTSYFISGDWTSYRSQTLSNVRVSWQVGSTDAAKARGWIAAFLPQASIVVTPGEINGMVGQQVTLVGRRPTAAQRTAGLDKPIFFSVGGGV